MEVEDDASGVNAHRGSHASLPPPLFRGRWLLLIAFILLCAAWAPRSVQTFDTGELVAAGMRLWVPHPPGYPLYVWLLHATLGLAPTSRPFFEAALLTSLYVAGGLALLIALADTWASTAIVFVLASLPVILRYALLPDVFGLHALLTAAVLYCVLCEDVRHREVLACIAFGLASANHQTIVFLAPALVYVLATSRSWRTSLFAALFGASVTCALYASLLVFDVDAPNSWGALHRLGDVLHHFLRRDFGSLRVFPGDNPAEPIASLEAFAVSTWPVLVLFALASAAFATRYRTLEPRHRRAWLVVAAGLALYVVLFIAPMNFPDAPRWSELRARFFIFPCVVMTGLSVRAPLASLHRGARLTWLGMAAALVLVNAVNDLPLRTLRHDTVVEDWARNILDTAARGDKPHFLVLDGDTEYFAARYVQALEGERETVLIDIGMAYDLTLFDKLAATRPAFRVDVDALARSANHGIVEHLVLPNIDAFDFSTALRFVSPRVRTVYHACGRRFERGEGIAFAELDPNLRLNPPDYDLRSGDPDLRVMWEAYADYYLARGRVAAARGDHVRSREAFELGWQIVPWCTPCQSGACEQQRASGVEPRACSE